MPQMSSISGPSTVVPDTVARIDKPLTIGPRRGNGDDNGSGSGGGSDSGENDTGGNDNGGGAGNLTGKPTADDIAANILEGADVGLGGGADVNLDDPVTVTTDPGDRAFDLGAGGGGTFTTPTIDLTNIASVGGSKLETPQNLSDDFAYRLQVYQPSGKADGPGYFRVDVTPERSLRKLKTMPKDVIILIDTSGSVWQSWVDHIAKGVQEGLDHLNQGDRFNIVMFNDDPRFFSHTRISPVTDGTIDAAKRFLRKAESGGMTDVNQALARLLVRDVAMEREYKLILITDGVPTEGIRDTRELINLITKSNDLNASIYCVGVGAKQNRPLLEYMAYRNGGYCLYAESKPDAAVKIRRLMADLRYPLIKDIKLDLVGVDIKNVFPHNVPTIHQGQTISIFGRFDEPSAFTLRLTGRAGTKLVDTTSVANLTKGPRGSSEIVRSWAFWKLQHLYSEKLRRRDTDAVLREIEQLKREFNLKTVE